MSPEPHKSSPGNSCPVLVEDLFLTDSFLIKGRVAGKYHRLTKMLEDSERRFISIEDAVMIALRGNEVVRTPSVMVNVKEIILAHELIDLGGDSAQRSLAQNAAEKPVRIRAFYSGSVQIELAGRIDHGAYEPAKGMGRRYFVMQDPVIRGLKLDGPSELRLLERLPYAIVQKDKLSYIYDFS